jgi:hypothetical protein
LIWHFINIYCVHFSKEKNSDYSKYYYDKVAIIYENNLESLSLISNFVHHN